MRILLDILEAVGGWNHGLHLHIDNQPYLPLVIEAMDESGPCGLPAISVTHYGKQNGDAMRDPEMCFELGFAGGAHLNPFYWRNDYLGIEQWSRFIRDSNYCYHTQLHEQHEVFAKLWDKNLRQQRFFEAFQQQAKSA
ncbi:MAG: hypothetical protein PW792_04730 [Acidobacteriaceae bacterium]|nr:hypothetical protein [Acidobacteriaceae bacterium]